MALNSPKYLALGHSNPPCGRHIGGALSGPNVSSFIWYPDVETITKRIIE